LVSEFRQLARLKTSVFGFETIFSDYFAQIPSTLLIYAIGLNMTDKYQLWTRVLSSPPPPLWSLCPLNIFAPTCGRQGDHPPIPHSPPEPRPIKTLRDVLATCVSAKNNDPPELGAMVTTALDENPENERLKQVQFVDARLEVHCIANKKRILSMV